MASEIKKSSAPRELDPMKKIVAEIISRAGLSGLPEADARYLEENLILQMNRRLGVILIENLPEEGRDEYGKLIADGPVPDPDKLRKIMEKYLPDYQTKIKSGLEAFAQEAVKSLSK